MNILKLYFIGLINQSKDKKLQKEYFQFIRKYQTKNLRRQIISSTLIILITIGAIFYLVNFNKEFKYNPNIFSNEEFNVTCIVLVILGLISFIFTKNVDVFEMLGMNNVNSEGEKITLEYYNGEDQPDAGGNRVKPFSKIDHNYFKL